MQDKAVNGNSQKRLNLQRLVQLLIVEWSTETKQITVFVLTNRMNHFQQSWDDSFAAGNAPMDGAFLFYSMDFHENKIPLSDFEVLSVFSSTGPSRRRLLLRSILGY